MGQTKISLMRVLGPPRPLRIAEWTQAQCWKILEAAWGNLAALISIEVAKKALEEVWETQLYAGMWPWETLSVMFYDALRLWEAQLYVFFVSGFVFLLSPVRKTRSTCDDGRRPEGCVERMMSPSGLLRACTVRWAVWLHEAIACVCGLCDPARNRFAASIGRVAG